MTTIGVSVAVPDPWGRYLQAYRTALGDATAAGIPTHVTLVPPCQVDPAQLPAVDRQLAGAAASSAAFTMHLRGTGSFRPVSPVVFVVVVEGISQCEMLASTVRRGPLAAELRFPYHPHVTVAQDLTADLLDKAFGDLADFECDFEVEGFSLFVHEPGTGWRATREFALGRERAWRR